MAVMYLCILYLLQIIQLGYASGIRAIRISYMGELGWELHIPTEVSLQLFPLKQRLCLSKCLISGFLVYAVDFLYAVFPTCV